VKQMRWRLLEQVICLLSEFNSLRQFSQERSDRLDGIGMAVADDSENESGEERRCHEHVAYLGLCHAQD
jgi:hypothetical protein